MVADITPVIPTRDQLSAVFKDQRVVKAFERLFLTTVPLVATHTQTIIETQVVAQTAAATAEYLSTILDSVTENLQANQIPNDPIEEVRLSDVAPVNQIEYLGNLVDVDAFNPTDKYILSFDSSTGYWTATDVIIGQLTDTTANLIASNVNLTDGAAAAVGTLNNAPAAGDPTKWIPIDDNGVTRYVPAW